MLKFFFYCYSFCYLCRSQINDKCCSCSVLSNKFNCNSCTFHQALEAVISSCLLKAHQAKFKSVAFPAIGAGNLKYPVQVIASTFVECIKKFSDSYQQTSLTDIRIIVMKNPDLEQVRFLQLLN